MAPAPSCVRPSIFSWIWASCKTKSPHFLKLRESYWRPNVLRQSLGQMQADSLHGRPITRDLDWGIPVPLEGWDGKRLYVWFEAVIGYLSATIEWSKLTGQPDAWKQWWHSPNARAYYFIGKDNIPFHAIIWPAQLSGAGLAFDELMGEKNPEPLVLPYDVPANEFMNLEGAENFGQPQLGGVGQGFLEPLRPRPAALLPDVEHAREQGHRLGLVRVLPPQQ